MATPIDPTVTMGVPVTKTKAQLQAEIDAAAAATAARAATISPLANSGYSNANVRESRVTTPYGSPALEVAAAQADATAGLAAMNDPAMNAAIEGGFTAAASPIGLAAGTINPVTGDYPAVVAPPVKKTAADYAAEQAAAAEKARLDNEKRDAFALIESTLSDYGFTAEEYNQLDAYISSALINPQIGPNQMVLEMRKLPVYKARFKGNETRVAAGMNALSEANYLAQENSMKEYLVAGGVAELGNRALYAELIGGGVAPTEVGKRINLAVDNVKFGDPQILKQMKEYYPGVTDKDLVSYFLNPKETLPVLQEKVTTSQIGAAFQEQGLKSDLASMTDLSKFGVSQTQAIAGAYNIATVLPTTSKLADIYGETNTKYTQETGTAEFLKSDAEAARKRQLLASAERGKFKGDSGVSAQVASLTRTKQGQF